MNNDEIWELAKKIAPKLFDPKEQQRYIGEQLDFCEWENELREPESGLDE
jgi:hypothetical protein